jgi:hypothetical protein
MPRMQSSSARTRIATAGRPMHTWASGSHNDSSHRSEKFSQNPQERKELGLGKLARTLSDHNKRLGDAIGRVLMACC